MVTVMLMVRGDSVSLPRGGYFPLPLLGCLNRQQATPWWSSEYHRGVIGSPDRGAHGELRWCGVTFLYHLKLRPSRDPWNAGAERTF